ncbi:MAG: hypothetical protein ACE5GF_05205 [Thermodesulfobacteriota bacterium]
MKKKKVKSFTVDGEVYAQLMNKLKEAKSGLSVSSLVDDYLGYLLNELKAMLDYYDSHNIEINRSWVINRVLEEARLHPPKWDIISLSSAMAGLMEQDVEEEALYLLEEYGREQEDLWQGVQEKKKKRQRLMSRPGKE